MPDRMPDNMPEDMPEDMPGRMPEDMPGRMPEGMPDRMPEDMPDKMPEDMSDRMPEDLPVTKRIDVMVGITRSKVINLDYSQSPVYTGHRLFVYYPLVPFTQKVQLENIDWRTKCRAFVSLWQSVWLRVLKRFVGDEVSHGTFPNSDSPFDDYVISVQILHFPLYK